MEGERGLYHRGWVGTGHLVWFAHIMSSSHEVIPVGKILCWVI